MTQARKSPAGNGANPQAKNSVSSTQTLYPNTHVLTTAGTDLRFMFHGTAKTKNYCPYRCEISGEATKAHTLFGDVG